MNLIKIKGGYMEVAAIIADNLKIISIGLAIFSVNLLVQAIMTMNQKQVIDIENKDLIIKNFNTQVNILMISGLALILIGIINYLTLNIANPLFITTGYSLVIIAGGLISWILKLKAIDYKKYGLKAKKWARIILYIAIALLLISTLLNSLITLRIIQ